MRKIAFDLHGPGWTPGVITQFDGMLAWFPDVLSNFSTDLGSSSFLPLVISFPPNSSPVTARLYHIRPPTAEQVEAVLDKFFSTGLFQQSMSPWASPAVGGIPKKSGGIRSMANYKKLNKISTLGQLPVSRVQEVLDNSTPVEYFHP